MPFARSDLPALSRRRMLGSLLGSSALLLPGCGSAPGAGGGTRASLASIARALFPYSFLPDERYAAVVDAFLGATPKPDTRAIEAAIKTAAPDGKADPTRIPALLATSFGQQFRFAALLGLFGDLTVTRRFGYQGPSLADGGYLDRGFDDLRWLPEPAHG